MPKPETFARSIFAYELERIVEPHKCHLEDFARSPLAFDKPKVEALLSSLNSVERLPALNHEEIMSVVYALRLNPQERNRIYAALIAVGVQRFMLQFLTDGLGVKRYQVTEQDCERAYSIAEEVRNTALIWVEQRRKQGDDLFRGKGTMPPMPPMPFMPTVKANSATSRQFTAALSAYDEAVALASLGQMNDDGGAGQEFIEQAHGLLQRALNMLEQLPLTGQAAEDWAYWHSEVRKSLSTVQRVRS